MIDSFHFCHGAPASDGETITRLTPDERLRALLAGLREPVVVCGQTHVQFDRVIDSVRPDLDRPDRMSRLIEGLP